VGDDPVVSYLAIRADETHRKGYISTKRNITAVYPFIEDGIAKEDVLRILEESGLGLPEYYKWRSRSGCYFCFFQQRIEWVGLLENHPEYYERAKQYERYDPITGKIFTWNDRESLQDLQRPERIQQIKEHYRKRSQRQQPMKLHASLTDLLVEEDEGQSCLICHL
jgi:hypothetical protein